MPYSNTHFSVIPDTLTDGSKTYDLHTVTNKPLWYAPDEFAADLAAEALNDVLIAFKDCGSNGAVFDLSRKIAAALEEHKNRQP
jgi:hypothetical protein